MWQERILHSQIVVVQSLSHVWFFAAPWTAVRQASLSFTISWSLLKFISIESVMLPNHLMLCCPLLLPSIFTASGAFPMSQIFVTEGQSVGASASVSVIPMNIQGWFPLGLTGLISLLPKGLSRVSCMQFKTSIFWCSAFSMAQLSHLYMTTKP